MGSVTSRVRENVVITLSRTRPSRHSGCQRCRIIRLYMMVVLGLVLLALMAGDKMHYMRAVTAEHIAAAIFLVGSIGFVVKFVRWRLELRREANDPEQT